MMGKWLKEWRRERAFRKKFGPPTDWAAVLLWIGLAATVAIGTVVIVRMVEMIQACRCYNP